MMCYFLRKIFIYRFNPLICSLQLCLRGLLFTSSGPILTLSMVLIGIPRDTKSGTNSLAVKIRMKAKEWF
jgi:hypothetical protein